MRYHTIAKNLTELNAMKRVAGDNTKTVFAGFMPSSTTPGVQRRTRHYIDEIICGENAGATIGDYYEIVFDSDYADSTTILTESRY